MATTPAMRLATEPANPDEFLHEQRYDGEMLGMHSDHIGPLFYAGQFFALAVSYSPTEKKPASAIWESLVQKLGTYSSNAAFLAKISVFVK